MSQPCLCCGGDKPLVSNYCATCDFANHPPDPSPPEFPAGGDPLWQATLQELDDDGPGLHVPYDEPASPTSGFTDDATFTDVDDACLRDDVLGAVQEPWERDRTPDAQELTSVPTDSEAGDEPSPTPEEEFANPAYAVDMRDVPGKAQTALGYTRDRDGFWMKMVDNWAGKPDSPLSEKNLARIAAKDPTDPPIADEQWIKKHPGQEMWEGDALVHHHWDQGPWAFAIPEQAHRMWHAELHPITYDVFSTEPGTDVSNNVARRR